jgi:hypothetical protein
MRVCQSALGAALHIRGKRITRKTRSFAHMTLFSFFILVLFIGDVHINVCYHTQVQDGKYII